MESRRFAPWRCAKSRTSQAASAPRNAVGAAAPARRKARRVIRVRELRDGLMARPYWSAAIGERRGDTVGHVARQGKSGIFLHQRERHGGRRSRAHHRPLAGEHLATQPPRPELSRMLRLTTLGGVALADEHGP